MLGSDSVTNVLLAVATGFRDRALNVVAMTDELDDAERSTLYRALADDGDASTVARRFGDALRSLGADRQFVNECYRVSFYAGDAWKRLSAGPLFAYFSANRAGSPLDKWIHYFPIYERHLARFQGRPVRVLEIGVYRGGGLDLLRSYLGPDASLVGVDIDQAARSAVAGRFPVEIGDQADREFLRRVSADHGPFDIVIDDGGHTMTQQVASVETLFPLMADEGTYIVEDCHTSYWPEYADQGGDGITFVEWLKMRIDDLHAYHYSRSEELAAPWQTRLGGIHVYDSIVALDVVSHMPPFSEVSGTKEFIDYSRGVAASQLEALATRDAAITQAAEAEGRLTQLALEAEAVVSQSQEDVRLLRGELIEAQTGIADLRRELDSMRSEFGAVNEELAHTRGDLLGAWGIIQEMRRSSSWRLTGPLRRVKSLLTRR